MTTDDATTPGGSPAQMVYVEQSMAGPLPPPELLRGYDEVAPGAAERIIAMAEREQQHRHEIINQAMQTDERITARGQKFGLAVGVTGLVVAGAIALFATTTQGATTAKWIGGGTLAAMVVAFVTGRLLQPRPPRHLTTSSNEQD